MKMFKWMMIKQLAVMKIINRVLELVWTYLELKLQMEVKFLIKYASYS